MYSCNRRLRLVGNQPTRPGNRPSHPARPSNRPSHPARPSKRPSHPARPGNRPSHPARPSNRPSHPTRPSNRPYHPALPTNRPPHLPHPAVGKCRLNPPPTILLQPSFSAIREYAGSGFRQRGSQHSMTTLTSLQEKKNDLMKTNKAGLDHLPTHSINALMRQRERARQLSANEMSSVTNSQQLLLVSYPHQNRPIGVSKTSQNSNDFSQLLKFYDSQSNNDLGVGSTTNINQMSQNVITLPSLTNRPVLSSQTLNNHASYVLPPISVTPKLINNGIEKARNFSGIRRTTDTLSNTIPLPPLPAATTLDGSRITSVTVQNSNPSLTCRQRAVGTSTTRLPAESQSTEAHDCSLSPWNDQ